MVTLSLVLDWALSVGMVVGPVLGYIPQYFEIKRTKNTEAFSTLVCFILLIANILRIFFWVGKRFEMTLLIQSIVMILAQLILLELMVRLSYRKRSMQRLNDSDRTTSLQSVFDPTQFWAWEFYGEYIIFLLLVALAVGAITLSNLFWLQSNIITEIIGGLALLIEATLAVPQLWRNFRNRSCEGLRWELLLAWYLGDGFKTFFFFYRQSPLQFLLCGIFQLFIDTLIALQMFFYRGNISPASSFVSDQPNDVIFVTPGDPNLKHYRSSDV